MPDEYNHKMSDLEFQKFNMKQQTELLEQEAEKEAFSKAGLIDRGDDGGIGVLIDDDFEINAADDDDDYSFGGSDDTGDDSLSLTGRERSNSEEEQEF